MKVLDMLATGKLTAEQANQLLAVLGVDEARPDEIEPEATMETLAEAPDQAAGQQDFGEFTFEQILQMGIVGVDPGFFGTVREAGLTDLSFDQILQMGTVGVDPAFVVRAREVGSPDLTFDQIIQLGTVGVDPSFINKVREAGLTDLNFDQIVQMGTVGVDPEFFMKVRAAGTQQ